MSNQQINKQTSKKRFTFLTIASTLVLIYLTFKVIVLPVVQTGIAIFPHSTNAEKITLDRIKIPELALSDIMLLVIIFLFHPQSSKIFETLDFSLQGFKAKFRNLENKVDEAQDNIAKFQQQQIDLLKQQQEEIDKLQRFMYRLLLVPNEIKILEALKKHSTDNAFAKFYVTQMAGANLRRLRDSKLIQVKHPSYRYIAEIEKASNYAKTDKDFINLTEYFILTQLGEDFLEKLDQLTDPDDRDVLEN